MSANGPQENVTYPGSQVASLGAQPTRYATRHSTNGTETEYGQSYQSSSNDGVNDRRLPGLAHLNIPPSPQDLPAVFVPQNRGAQPASKHVRFIHLLDGGEKNRLTLSTKINTHDSTQSIIDAVRNFFGLFTCRLGFEDITGSHIIPSYDNFEDNATIYLRGDPDATAEPIQYALDPQNLSPTKTFPMLPPASNQPLSRSGSRLSNGFQLAPGFEYTPQVSPTKNAGFDASPAEFTDHRGTGEWLMQLPGGSVEDATGGSKIASAEISEANIVDGGRRKRAKFDTQDLPLFQPMQVASAHSISSASPVRRPYQQTSSAQNDGYALSHTDTTPNRAISQRNSLYNGAGRRRGVLPTPDHTTASAMSDEDVAWQLVSLSDYGRQSNRGRTSTSTVDDAHSGKAVTSDAEDVYSEEEDDAQPNRPAFKIYQDEQGRSSGRPNGHRHGVDGESSGEDYEDGDDGSFKGASSELDGTDRRKGLKIPTKSSKSHKSHKHSHGGKTTKKDHTSNKAPPSPRSLSASSRKPSNASLGFTTPLTPLAPDETDLSSKPRCQRCRKSKKGCDRQRPCGRCKDAGLGADDCVSEEETNNKKGRYGRHMGVVIKKENEALLNELPPNPYGGKAPGDVYMMDQQSDTTAEKQKKRKR